MRWDLYCQPHRDHGIDLGIYLMLSRRASIALHFQTEEPDLHDTLNQQSAIHRQAGLQGIHPEHYAGSHWLASFALEVVHPRNV